MFVLFIAALHGLFVTVVTVWRGTWLSLWLSTLAAAIVACCTGSPHFTLADLIGVAGGCWLGVKYLKQLRDEATHGATPESVAEETAPKPPPATPKTPDVHAEPRPAAPKAASNLGWLLLSGVAIFLVCIAMVSHQSSDPLPSEAPRTVHAQIPAPVEQAVLPVAAPAPPVRTRRPPRSTGSGDVRHCLELPTMEQIARCSE